MTDAAPAWPIVRDAAKAVSAASAGGPIISGVTAAGYGLAVVIAGVCAVQAFVGSDGALGRPLSIALLANLGLVLVVCASIGLRVWGVARGSSGALAAPRLHLRLVGFLSVAAIAPAILAAAFLGTMFVRVLDSWFSDRFQSVVESSAGVARTYLELEARNIRVNLRQMATDLNRTDAAAALTESPGEYASYLRTQALSSGFTAAAVLDSTGSILARTGDVEPSAILIPPPDWFASAASGELVDDVDRAPGRVRTRLMLRLPAYPDGYLLVVRDFDAEVTSFLERAEEAVSAYREAEDRRGRLQGVLGLLYLQSTLLILAGAAWLGLVAADRIATPIGRLARAAARVRDGDLGARVLIDDRADELATLARAFNEMTDQLRSQREDLLEAKEDAEDRRRFTEAVLAGVSAGVVGVDGRGFAQLANASARTVLDETAETPVQGREFAVVAPEFAHIARQAREAPGRVVHAEVDLERAGALRNFDVRAAAAADGSGAVVVTFADITRLVSAQRNAAWRDVARRIAHEIKNPLTPIQLSAERLRRKYRSEIKGDIETFDRCVDTIVRQVADIGRMVDEFSSFARMPTPQAAQADLVEIVRAAVFTRRVATPTIHFAAETPDTPVHVVCDERLVSQALVNLLKNASEAVIARIERDPGVKGAPGRIDVALTVAEGEAHLLIEDNGVGWPTAARERLLEPYMTTREKGTGLGLAIVQRIVEDHHGRLDLLDRADGHPGAAVRVVLPLEPLREDAPEADADALDTTTPSTPVATAPQGDV